MAENHDEEINEEENEDFIPEGVVFRRDGGGIGDDWDDSMLIKAWDKSMKSHKTRAAVQVAMQESSKKPGREQSPSTSAPSARPESMTQSKKLHHKHHHRRHESNQSDDGGVPSASGSLRQQQAVQEDPAAVYAQQMMAYQQQMQQMYQMQLQQQPQYNPQSYQYPYNPYGYAQQAQQYPAPPQQYESQQQMMYQQPQHTQPEYYDPGNASNIAYRPDSAYSTSDEHPARSPAYYENGVPVLVSSRASTGEMPRPHARHTPRKTYSPPHIARPRPASSTRSELPAEMGMPPLPEDEALANLLLSWYYSGYYTAMYVAKNKHR